MRSMENLITTAIAIVGLANMSRAVGVRHQSVRQWERAGKLPRTDWTGETNYAAAIETATGGKVTRAMLLECRR